MTTNFYLDFRGRAKDGKGSLLIIIAHNSTTASVSTGIRLSHDEWKDGKIIHRDNCTSLNAVIKKKKGDLDLAIAILSADERFPYMTATEIKNAVVKKNKENYNSESRLLCDLFQEYMKADLRPGTKEIYKTTLNKIVIYAGPKCSIDDINYKWLIGFERFLAKTQGVNGRAIYLRSLRAICNYARKTGLRNEYAFEEFPVKNQETRKLSVPIEKLREFHDIKVSKSLERYRDYFFLMFYLIGINIGDLIRLKKDAIVDGRLEYVRAKTHKLYSIKIEPEAEYLISKYSGKSFLLDALDTCKHIKNFMHMMNDALKEVGYVSWEMVPDEDDLFAPPKLRRTVIPVIPGCRTNYARHCWATYAQDIGIPVDVVSHALGHSSGNRTTLIYIKPNQEQVDSANRQVIDYFFNK